MRKILLSIIISVSLALVGCGSDNDSNKAQNTNTTPIESGKSIDESKTTTPKSLYGETLGGGSAKHESC